MYRAVEITQQVKVPVSTPSDLDLIPWAPHGERGEPIPSRCPLTPNMFVLPYSHTEESPDSGWHL